MSDLRALVLGAGGQLGRACMESVPEQVTAQGLPRSECHITDAAALKQTMGDLLPQVVINAAAYTAVDQAEEDIDAARAVNADAPALIADLCVQHNARLTRRFALVLQYHSGFSGSPILRSLSTSKKNGLVNRMSLTPPLKGFRFLNGPPVVSSENTFGVVDVPLESSPISGLL